MKTIIKTHEVQCFNSRLMEQYFHGMRIGVFDIETMGLNPERSPLILSGMLTTRPDGGCLITQHFAESYDDEAMLLEALRCDFDKVDFLLTYNGRSFDLPFVEKRARSLKLPPFDLNRYNMDLYLMISGYSEIRHILKNIKQKTVEAYMGLNPSRRDSISGAESVEMYKNYLSADAEKKRFLEDKILLHNHDDLLQLYKLLPIIKQLDFHRALNASGFPVAGENGWPYLNVSNARATSKEFVISGKYYGPPFSYISYNTFFHYYFCQFYDDGSFIFKLPVDRHKGNSFISLRLYFDDFRDLERYPHCVNDFLLVTRGSKTCCLESNMFTQKFLRQFMNETVCPVNVL